MEQMKGIHAVDDVDMMPFFRQRVRETVQIHGVATEVVGRIERCQVKKVEGPAHALATFPMTSINCRAAWSQVSRAAELIPHRPIRSRSSGLESSRSMAPVI